jgi:hypothetical protein
MHDMNSISKLYARFMQLLSVDRSKCMHLAPNMQHHVQQSTSAAASMSSADKTRRDTMGPFPHDAPRASISEDNPAGTNGFEFVEFAHPEPEVLEALFARMGYEPVARHRTKAITVWRQGDINYILNAEKGSFADALRRHSWSLRTLHGLARCRCQAGTGACRLEGCEEYKGEDKTLDVPAIVGIGGSLLYFVDTWGDQGSAYDAEFDWLGERDPRPKGAGFYYLDHLTHNVIRGNMDKWWDFLPQPVQLQADPLLRHRGQADRPGVARHHLALWPHPHPAQRVHRRQEPDRGISAQVQWRGHPAHRGRHRRHLFDSPTGSPTRASSSCRARRKPITISRGTGFTATTSRSTG